MRLIDADELSRKIQDEYHGSYSEVQIAPYQIDRMIDAQPTVDAVTVVHAHWTRTVIDGNKGYIRCSNCGADFSLPVYKMQGFYQRYCGTCGAKMIEPQESEG